MRSSMWGGTLLILLAAVASGCVTTTTVALNTLAEADLEFATKHLVELSEGDGILFLDATSPTNATVHVVYDLQAENASYPPIHFALFSAAGEVLYPATWAGSRSHSPTEAYVGIGPVQQRTDRENAIVEEKGSWTIATGSRSAILVIAWKDLSDAAVVETWWMAAAQVEEAYRGDVVSFDLRDLEGAARVGTMAAHASPGDMWRSGSPGLAHLSLLHVGTPLVGKGSLTLTDELRQEVAAVDALYFWKTTRYIYTGTGVVTWKLSSGGGGQVDIFAITASIPEGLLPPDVWIGTEGPR